ncbi:hypothetical protein GCM10023238_34360 [Streptomyces heliomycini]
MGFAMLFEQYVPVGKPDTMTLRTLRKWPESMQRFPHPTHWSRPSREYLPTPRQTPAAHRARCSSDRLAGWVSDLTTLHELTDRLARASTLDGALRELLRAGAALVGARRGLVTLEPADGLGPTPPSPGLARADLGHMETVPRGSLPYGRNPRRTARADDGVAEPDLFAEEGARPPATARSPPASVRRSFALPLAAGDRRTPGRRGVALRRAGRAVEAAAPPRRACTSATPPSTWPGSLELERTQRVHGHDGRGTAALPPPTGRGVRLAARHRTSPHGGGDWYDALPLPNAALGLAVGSVTGSGAGAGRGDGPVCGRVAALRTP